MDFQKIVTNCLKEVTNPNLPVPSFKPLHIIRTINIFLNSWKAAGFDNIKGKILQQLSYKEYVFITALFNRIQNLKYILSQWKIADIIMDPKLNKPAHEVTSYIDRLVSDSVQIFDKLLLKQLTPVMLENNIIPKHQFKFRGKHSTNDEFIE